MNRLRNYLDRFDTPGDGVLAILGTIFVVVVIGFVLFHYVGSGKPGKVDKVASTEVTTTTTVASGEVGSATSSTTVPVTTATTVKNGKAPASTSTTVHQDEPTTTTTNHPGVVTTTSTTVQKPSTTTSTTIKPTTTTTSTVPPTTTTTTTTIPKPKLPSAVAGPLSAASRIESARLIFGEAASNGNGDLHYEYDAFYGQRKTPTEYLTETGWHNVPFGNVIYFPPFTGQVTYQVRACSASEVCGPASVRIGRFDVYEIAQPVITVGRSNGVITWSWTVIEYDLSGGMGIYAPEQIHHFSVSLDNKLTGTVGVLHAGTGTGQASGFVTIPDDGAAHSINVVAITIVDGTTFYSPSGQANLAGI